eukprot:TRINITY_DN452_c0_g1_i1.p1 TRINITY_DN452_c0_g1~~TRINITY_DN452_c0_g1_i1.p1  ORF type:complete len:467 (+),score=151.71 TRINITY_DN452_c0_g1_i1:181-1581(+)
MDTIISESIQEGDTAVLRSHDGRWNILRILRGKTCKMGKHRALVDPLIGLPWGAFFEVDKGKIVPIEGLPMTEYRDFDTKSVTGDNRNAVQMSSKEEHVRANQTVLEWKESGISGRELVDKLLERREGHTSTAFSKEKYRKKKVQKYMNVLQIVRPTSSSMIRLYFAKKPDRFGFLREDTLGQILSFANVCCGTQCLVVDAYSSFIAACIAERMQGDGRVLCAQKSTNPDPGVIPIFGFSPKLLSTIHLFPLKLALIALEKEKHDEYVATETGRDGGTQDRHRRVVEWLRQGSESLVIAAGSGVQMCFLASYPLLVPSGSFAVYCPFIEPILELKDALLTRKAAARLTVTESFLREFQVIPMRTHPNMSLTDSSGYILSGVKLLDEDGKDPMADILPKCDISMSEWSSYHPIEDFDIEMEMEMEVGEDGEDGKDGMKRRERERHGDEEKDEEELVESAPEAKRMKQ